VLVASSELGLQASLNGFIAFCKDNELVVNEKKTKVI
jgi:hypothetical protein